MRRPHGLGGSAEASPSPTAATPDGHPNSGPPQPDFSDTGGTLQGPGGSLDSDGGDGSSGSGGGDSRASFFIGLVSLMGVALLWGSYSPALKLIFTSTAG